MDAKEKRPHPRGGVGRPKHEHTGIGSTESYVHIRHPDSNRNKGGDGPFGGETYLLDIPGSESPESGVPDPNCNPFADVTCYPLDDFARTYSGGTYSAGDSAGSLTHYRGSTSGPSTGLEGVETPFTLEESTDRSIDSTLGSGARSWLDNPGLGCEGLSFTFIGWWERSHWWKLTVPEHPANMAGMTIGPLTFIAETGLAGGRVGQAEGATLVVKGSEPTSVRDGTPVAHLANGVTQNVFISGGHIPAEGGELWFGVIPNWRADLGSFTCGFRWPWMDGQGNSATCYVLEGNQTVTWQIWDGAADAWGSGLDGDTTGAWWSGNLPWDVSATGGTFGYNGEALYLTVPAGSNETLIATMPGVDEWGPSSDDDEGDYGEPWTSEFGVRMKARFKLTTAGSLTEAGLRDLRFRWHNGLAPVSVTVHLGDTERAQGLAVESEGAPVFTAKDITEDSWMWVSLDARNPGYLRAKMWVEGTTYGSGESAAFDVQASLDDDSEDPSQANYFEVRIRLGNETGADQTVQVDGIWFCNGGDDCDWVEERIGQGDGSRNVFYTSMPYKPNSLWFFVDGLHVLTDTLDYNQGEFQTIDKLPVAENAIMVARYRVDLNPDGD